MIKGGFGICTKLFVFVFRDLSLAIRPFTEIFRFQNPKLLKYGQLVLPFLPANFGPMYFSKIERIT